MNFFDKNFLSIKFFLKKIDIPNKKIKIFNIKLIFIKKCVKVLTNAKNMNPKKTFSKNLISLFRFIILPNPDKDIIIKINAAKNKI